MLRREQVREGIIAGVLGASVIALWFFVADVIAGQPLRTPLLLAQAMVGLFGGAIGDAVVLPVAAYTLFHFAAFIGVGLLVASLFEASIRTPGLWAGLFLIFAVFEVGFYGLCLMLSMVDVIGALAWYQIGAANLLAATVMGTYIWRHHPEAAHNLDAALKGTTP